MNGSLIQEDTEIGIDNFGRNLTIDLHIIQAKLEAGFGETTIQKFNTTFNELFDLSNSLDQFQSVYNTNLLDIVKKFRQIWTVHASKFPEFNVNFHYVSIGDEIHTNVQRLVADLERTVIGLFSSSRLSFDFLGAAAILQLTRQVPASTYPLRFAENTISSGEQSYICLVNLVEYYNFICDSEGHLRRRIFEANVRDYQGSRQVNQGIQDTLANPDDNEFWWLNNGITMISSRTSSSGRTITIENPMIVNGMQTSFEIFKHFSNIESESRQDQRNILVRIIGITETPNELDTRNRVIKATNSQTAIQAASLRATDPIQRNIEDYLKAQGYYYDRRKNYYRNERKPYNRIISITYLAQSIISIVLRRPNDARARPSTLIREEEDYSLIFNTTYPILLYLKCIQIMKRAEEYLRTKFPGIISTEINNHKFHLAMFASLLLSNNPQASAEEIVTIRIEDMTPDFLDRCFETISTLYDSLGKGNYLASKDRGLVDQLNDRLIESTYPRRS